MRRRSLAIGPLIFAVVAAAVTAQTTAQKTAQTAPVEAVIYVQDLTPGTLGDRIRDILVTRIADKFAAFNLHQVAEPILVDASQTANADFRVEPLLAQKLPAATDLVVAAIFKIQATSVDIQFILLDPKQKNVLGGVLSRARTGLTVFTSVDSAVNDLDPVLKQYVTNRYEYRPPQGVVDTITLESSLEGEEVYFAGRDVGKVSGGALNVPYTPFPVGSKVRVEIRKPGYHSEETVIALPSTEVKTTIPALQRASRFSAGLDWRFGQPLGFGVTGRFYGVPDWTYVQLSAYRDLVPQTHTGFHDLRHYDFGAAAGQYLFLSYRSAVRVSVSLGLGVIYTSLEGTSISDFVDVYLDLLSPTVEFRLSGWQLFVQPQLKFALGLGDNLLGRSWILTSLGIPPITIGVMRSW